MHPPTVAVADDEKSVRALLEIVFRGRGYHVFGFSDGAAVLAFSRTYAGEIDLLVTDIDMPGLNGADLARQLLLERPGIRVLLISGASSRAAAGTLPFLAKPFTIDQLSAAADVLLGTSQESP
jgi:DNA-binding NtrC family response regulator